MMPPMNETNYIPHSFAWWRSSLGLPLCVWRTGY